MIMGMRAAQSHPQPPGLHDKSPGHHETMVGNTTEAYGPKLPGQLCSEPDKVMNFHLETMSRDSSVLQCVQLPLLHHWLQNKREKLTEDSLCLTGCELQTSKHRFYFVIVCLSCVEQACPYTILKRGWVHKRLLESWTSQSPVWTLGAILTVDMCGLQEDPVIPCLGSAM